MPYALEITGKDIDQITAAKAIIPPGSQIKIAFLGNETHAQRLNAARVIRAAGFEPMPIISSRRLTSEADADAIIGGYQAAAQPRQMFIVGGDPATPAGPYQDSMALIASGMLQRHGVTQIGITGYPEGHPHIPTDKLWDALLWKQDYLNRHGIEFEITTQFGFDPEAIIDWMTQLRARGVPNLVRIGIPGPTNAAKLLRFAKQFGVRSSTDILRRYGISLSKLLLPVGPDRFFQRLETAKAGKDLGQVDFHLYPFGGIRDGVIWMNSVTETV